MCDPITALTGLGSVLGGLGGLLGGSQKAPTPQAPAPAPQASKAPDVAGVRAGVAANGGAPSTGPGGGEASTFLSGPGGVDNSKLTLGRNALLGM